MKKYGYILLFMSLCTLHIRNISEAAEVDDKINSNMKLNLVPNESGKAILNPLDPEEKLTVVDNLNDNIAYKEGPKGVLTIDFVSNFKFENIDASGEDVSVGAEMQQAYDVSNKKIQVPNFIQVSDTRGTNGSWQLTVKQNTKMTTTSSEYPELTGATFHLKNVKHSSTGISDSSVQVAQDFPVTLGEEQVVMSAKNGEGSGTNIVYWEKKGVELNIPGNSPKLAQKYHSEFIWSLVDIPN